MIVPVSNATARLALLIVAVALAAALAYSSTRNALAVRYAGLNTRAALERATQLERGNPLNWLLLGHYWQYNLEEPDTAAPSRPTALLSLSIRAPPLRGSISPPLTSRKATPAPLAMRFCRPHASIRYRPKFPGVTEIFFCAPAICRRLSLKFATPFTSIPSAPPKPFRAAGESILTFT